MYPGLQNDGGNWSTSEYPADRSRSNDSESNIVTDDQRDNHSNSQGRGGAVGAGSSKVVRSSSNESTGSVVIDWSLGFGGGLHSPFSKTTSTTVRVVAAHIQC